MPRRVGTASWVAMTRTMLRIELDQLDRCLEEVHDTLAGRLAEFQQSIEEHAAKLSPDSREDWYEWNRDTHWELSEVFPRILRHSLFVTTYGFLEHTLLRVCRHLEYESPRSVGLSDLKPEGIELARVYLKKVREIPFPDQSVEWNRLSWYRKIRNCLVHNDSRVPPKDKGQPIRDFFAKNSNLGAVDELGRIALTHAACEDIILVTRRFLDQLFGLLRPVSRGGSR